MDTPELSSEALQGLIDRAREGDQAAFSVLMQAHYELTFRTVVAIVRNEHDARELCQDVWLKVWRDLGAYRGEAKFTTWLHPIATRRAIDHLRKRRRWFDRFLSFARSDEADAPPREFAAVEDTRDGVQQAEAAARYEHALQALPPRARAVLALREIQGLSYEEIAHALACPVGTVMSRLHHARRLLAEKLKTDPL